MQSSGLDSPSLTVGAQRLLTLLIAGDAGSSVVIVVAHRDGGHVLLAASANIGCSRWAPSSIEYSV
ncbi:hypothetical protein [Streptomyces sp. ME19-01-6]|uniref:hypothetical protein n=1 Tax=Streptomyces sp. ME19-01-6 TaxID=3028686 RepID=UPI0029A79F05|nr:hypothetical protein [Streptomyces sp. ME19-01-6]MDX3234016.1 hypothetical protein [Streptomyces sp. ME19-01-6]